MLLNVRFNCKSRVDQPPSLTVSSTLLLLKSSHLNSFEFAAMKYGAVEEIEALAEFVKRSTNIEAIFCSKRKGAVASQVQDNFSPT